jgi:hypothetical protein
MLAVKKCYSTWLNLNPAEIRVFFKTFYEFEASEKKISPVGRQPFHLPARSALSSAFMVKNAF